MAMYELDGNHLLPVRLGRSADAITLSHSLVAIQRQIVDVLRRPLFPLSWEELETGASLTALDATGQVVVVEVLERVDSTGLLAAMSRLTQAATAGRREIASRYAGGLGAFSQDWNEFREAMPAQVEAGPRLTILSASLEPDVVGGLGVLASSGLEIHEVDVRIVDESRIVVVVEKISGMDVAAGGPLLVARAPRPALAGSASSGSNGSRGMDATEQAEHMSPVTGPIEIVMPSEPVTAPEAGGVDDASAAIPAGAFAATGAADALSELFEPVAVTAEQPQVHALSAQGGDEAQPEEPAEADDAQAAMSSAIRSVIMRILVFYVGSVLLLIALLPWDSDEMKTNAFAAVLSMAGVPAVGTIMNIIIFMALISAFSANIYASSRMAYSLSARDMGSRWLLGASASNKARARSVVEAALEDDEALLATELQGDIEAGRTPKRAVGLVVVLALLAVLGNWYLPGSILTMLINAIGMVLLIVWTFIIISLMRLHPSLERSGSLVIRMPGWPWLPWLVLAGLGGIGVLMLMSDEGRAQLVSMGALTLVIVAIYFVRQLVGARKRA